ncbi:MAG: hypothetical protein RSE50_01030, partial [Myroides sp.]
YTQRKLYEYTIGKQSTYKDNEISSNLINALFDIDCKPSDLNYDDNDTANKAIQLNSELNRFLDYKHFYANEMSNEDVFAFLNSIEYDPKLIWVKVKHLQYPKALNELIFYNAKKYSFNEYRLAILKWHNSDFPFSCNIRHMAKSLIRAEQYLLNLLQKRKKRSLLKNKCIDFQ